MTGLAASQDEPAGQIAKELSERGGIEGSERQK